MPSWLYLSKRQLRERQELQGQRVRVVPPPAEGSRRRRVKYSLNMTDSPRAPWADSMTASLGPTLGTDSLGQTTLSLLQGSLVARTYGTYGSALKPFLSFAATQGFNPLEATPVEAARYVAWLGLQGTVAADSLQPYLSSINRFLQDHGKAPVALGPLVAGVRKGLRNAQQVLQPKDPRLAITAQAALAILETAEELQPQLTWRQAGTGEYLLRACVAVLVNYLFFARGETGVQARSDDLSVDSSHLCLYIRVAKGRGHLQRHQRPVLRMDRRDVERVAALVAAYHNGRCTLHPRQSGSLPEHLWALQRSELAPTWTADTMSTWLQQSLQAAGQMPPPGFSWTSHSLRMGAASAANAICVPLTKIRYMGGWARNSDVVLDYIDPTMQPSQAAHLFFGFLLAQQPL